MARPSKLTLQVQETLVAALRTGAWFSDACRAAGVKKSTAHEWHRRGRGEDPRPPTPAHVAFAQAVDAALRANQSEPELNDAFAATQSSEETAPGEQGYAGLTRAKRGVHERPEDEPDEFAAPQEQAINRPIELGENRPFAAQRDPARPSRSDDAPEFAASVETVEKRSPVSSEQAENRDVCGPASPQRRHSDVHQEVAHLAQPHARAREVEDSPRTSTHVHAQAEKGEVPMELEVTITIPVAGATMTIPTRQRIHEPGAPGGRVVDSIHVAAVDDLASVELVDGRLRLELKSGEKYQFPIAALLTDERPDATLKLQEQLPGGSTIFGGVREKFRIHELQLARVSAVRLVEPESASTPERWSERQPESVTGMSDSAAS
jgi:hypothetical protein